LFLIFVSWVGKEMEVVVVNRQNPKGEIVYVRSWPLSTLVPGDEVTLTYSAEFPTNTVPGVYRNVARVTGQRNETTVKDQIIKMPASEGWSEVKFEEVKKEVPKVLGVATSTPAVCVPLLTTDMSISLRNNPDEVKTLQQFLNSDPDTQVALSGPGSPGNETGYFGLLTDKAVRAFQSKYASEVLYPLGIQNPTGGVYSSTRAKINELACGLSGGNQETVQTVNVEPNPTVLEDVQEETTSVPAAEPSYQETTPVTPKKPTAPVKKPISTSKKEKEEDSNQPAVEFMNLFKGLFSR